MKHEISDKGELIVEFEFRDFVRGVGFEFPKISDELKRYETPISIVYHPEIVEHGRRHKVKDTFLIRFLVGLGIVDAYTIFRKNISD